jgi:hypothetical protein
MNHTPKGKCLSWSELAVLAMWAWVIIFGLWANNSTLWQSLVSITFGATALLLARCWQLTLRGDGEQPEPPPDKPDLPG